MLQVLSLLSLLHVATHFLLSPGPQLPPLSPGILDARIVSEEPGPFPNLSLHVVIREL